MKLQNLTIANIIRIENTTENGLIKYIETISGEKVENIIFLKKVALIKKVGYAPTLFILIKF